MSSITHDVIQKREKKYTRGKREGDMSGNSETSPSLPWKTRLSCAIISASTDAACRRDGTVNRRLTRWVNLRVGPNENPTKGVKTADVTVDASRNLWFRVFTPTETADDVRLPVVVFFHGGGFAFLSADSIGYDFFCRRMARKIPAVVVSVTYRLTPESRYPAQYDDGYDVIEYLDNSSCMEGYAPNADLSKCFAAGDSAGANIAHNVTRRISETKCTFRRVRVLGVLAIQPFFGGEERTPQELRLKKAYLVSVDRTDFLWKMFLPEGSDRDHDAVNVSGPRAIDISGLNFPATLVVVAGFDPLQDWQRRYYEWLKKSGKEAYLVEYPDTIHAFYMFPELPEGSQLIRQMKDFIQNRPNKHEN